MSSGSRYSEESVIRAESAQHLLQDCPAQDHRVRSGETLKETYKVLRTVVSATALVALILMLALLLRESSNGAQEGLYSQGFGKPSRCSEASVI